MKFRKDFVTNSSSSSYIVCFARVSNEEKARPIIEEYCLTAFGADEIRQMSYWSGTIGADWADAYVYVNDVISEHPDDKYILIEDYCDAIEHDYDDVEYFYDFGMQYAIDDITEENGFSNIEVSVGEGRNG